MSYQTQQPGTPIYDQGQPDPALSSLYQTQYSAPPPQQAPRRRSRISCRTACLGCGLIFVAGTLLFLCVGLTAGLIIWNNLYQQVSTKWDTALKQDQQQTFQTARVYDRAGNELHEVFGEGRRTEIKITDMPQSLLDATTSVEDSSFYTNNGVDMQANLRAGWQYLTTGQIVSGGSTITQQLVRGIAFDYQYRTQQSFQRKFEEIIMALIVTREKSKNDILEMYLNQIYYGHLAYGIEAAAQTYFGKSAKDLSLAEASLLAGLPQQPADLDPLNPDPAVQQAVLDRRKTVLNLMVANGKITRAQADSTLAEVLHFADPNVNLKSPHFTLYAENELKTLLDGLGMPPSTLNTAGLQVYTTLDPAYESMAESVAGQQIASIKAEHNANNSAVVILKPQTGEILAMMGSVNYHDPSIQGQVNVATAKRQPGSAIKPIMYSAAMERGFNPASVLWDVETHIQTPSGMYSPVDYDRQFHGPVRLRYALANSYNIPAVQTLRTIGVPALLNMAARFRITSLGTDPSQYGLALTLGGGELTPLELTEAYSVFANGGKLVSATSILCVMDSNHHVIYQYEGQCNSRGSQDASTINTQATAKQVLDPRIAFMISDILGDNVARTPAMGPNSPLRTDNLVTSVKTGTTDDFRDNWTVGYTHNVVVGVWVGNTDDKPMIHTTGLTGAAPIWHDIITGIYADPNLLQTLKRAGNLVPDTRTPPPGLLQKRICDLGLLKEGATACTFDRVDWFMQSAPLVPDANGQLDAQGVIQPPPTRSPANGPLIIDVDMGVAQTAVVPLDPSLAAGYVASQRGVPTIVPHFCMVPQEVRAQVPNAVEMVFIKPPLFPDDQINARIYAQNYGIAILPQIPCTPEMLVPPAPQVAGVVAQISSPQAFETVTKTVQVVGSVNWPAGSANFFKVEIEGPQFPAWTTVGTTHNNPVDNGLLEQFGAEGLQPGVYKLRITIIGKDGGIMATSPEIPVTVTGQ